MIWATAVAFSGFNRFTYTMNDPINNTAPFEGGTVFGAAVLAEALPGGKNHLTASVIKGVAIAGAQVFNERIAEPSGSDLPSSFEDLAKEILEFPEKLDPTPDIFPRNPS